MAKVLMIASNYGLWAEELQAPWDRLRQAGHRVQLCTKFGKTPLPLKLSVDPSLRDPTMGTQTNPEEVVQRINEILDANEWSNPIKISDANMDDYQALVIVGGPGCPFDISGNPLIHQLILSAYKSNKLISALCYAVGALAFTRDADNNNKSVIYGKTVTAHPHSWDFEFDLSYVLTRATPENHGTDIITQGFVYPLQYLIEDAVGNADKVLKDPTTNRNKPLIAFDWPFLTALSVESSRAFGDKLVELLSEKTV